MKTKMIVFTCFLGCIVMLSDVVNAATYHVAKTGNDNNSGLQASPYLTISKAAQMAQPGDSVIVHAGIYREWVQPARGGTSESARITYKAAIGEAVVIKGSEQIANWQDQGGGVWKVDLPDSFFTNHTPGSAWYPFRDTIVGRYTGATQGKQELTVGGWCHLGEVYLDGKMYMEKQTRGKVDSTLSTWYTFRNGTIQSIYANFGTNNPNTQFAEINVRQAVFGIDVQNGINYITVDGFTITQSAEEWLPPYTNPNSRGAIFTSGSNWTIQNCTVTFAKMRGICMDGTRPANHIIRNNTVEECGSAGIAGANDDGTIVIGNWIRNIHGTQSFYGPEHGGIKFNTSGNVLICGNIITKIRAQMFAEGIWLDYGYGNNRITGNVIMDATDNLIDLENPSGPQLVDNNILYYGSSKLESGNVYINNFLFHHTLLVAPGGWGNTDAVDNKFYNNICSGTSFLGIPPNSGNAADYNAFLSYDGKKTLYEGLHSIVDNAAPPATVTLDTINRSVTVTFTLSDSAFAINCPIVTTNSLGSLITYRNRVAAQLKNPDNSMVAVDRDFFQYCRGAATKIGPFSDVKTGLNTYVVQPN